MSVLDPVGPFSQLLPTEEAAVAYFTAKRWSTARTVPILTIGNSIIGPPVVVTAAAAAAGLFRSPDVSRREIETVNANSPLLKRVQRIGWRRRVALGDGECLDPDDDPEIVLSREVLVDDEEGSVMNSPG